MSERPPNVLGIWDLDRADALFHLRKTFSAEPRIGKRDAGRYHVALGQPGKVQSFPVADITVLARVLREMMDGHRRDGVPIRLIVVGLPDTVTVVETIAAEWRASSDIAIDLHVEPQHVPIRDLIHWSGLPARTAGRSGQT